ncbi:MULTISPECIES: hypothetical protein [Burkholderia]|uniref:hypothetical protein n=1 Tax=Burkholderia TaxID=32008 RepID=UPI00104510F1|nr:MULTISPECIES: hypothetical protein [Burkholderia]
MNMKTASGGLPQSTVNMISANGDWLGMHGTGFFARLDGYLFLITARHCLGTLGSDLTATAARLLVPADITSSGMTLSIDTCVNFTHVGLAKASTNFDDYVGADGDMDLACLVASKERHDLYEIALHRSTDLHSTPELLEKIASCEAPPKLIVHGFSSTTPDVGIEDNGARLASARLLGTYAGRGRYPHTHKLRITDRGVIDDLDGMSGSPIYAKVPPPPWSRRNPYILIGMAVIAGGDYLEFIGQQEIVRLARDVLESECLPR